MSDLNAIVMLVSLPNRSDSPDAEYCVRMTHWCQYGRMAKNGINIKTTFFALFSPLCTVCFFLFLNGCKIV